MSYKKYLLEDVNITPDTYYLPENERFVYLTTILLNGVEDKQISDDLAIEITKEYLKNKKLSKKNNKHIKDIEDGKIINEEKSNDEKTKKIRELTKDEIDLNKIPKEVLIKASIELMNKTRPNENGTFRITNSSSVTKDKIVKFIEKQNFDKKELDKIIEKIYNERKESNKKGLINRKKTLDEIKKYEKANNQKYDIDRFLGDKQKDIENALFNAIVVEKERQHKSVMRDYETINKNAEDTFKSLKSSTKKIMKDKDLGEIMKGHSELVKKGKKYAVETELDIKKGLEPKVKKALKKSVITELDKKIDGSGIRDLELSSDSEYDEPKRKRGRPKKGKGFEPFDDDSSSDEEDIKTYGKVLEHLIKHIKDPKEKIDKKDYKQSIELIKKIMKKKK